MKLTSVLTSPEELAYLALIPATGSTSQSETGREADLREATACTRTALLSA